MPDIIDHHMRPAEGQVLLFDPEHISMTYGPADDIKFGPKGNAEDHFALVDEGHPLLSNLLRDYPLIRVVEDGPTQVFVCVQCSPETEWKSRAAYRAHQRAKHVAAVVSGAAPA